MTFVFIIFDFFSPPRDNLDKKYDSTEICIKAMRFKSTITCLNTNHFKLDFAIFTFALLLLLPIPKIDLILSKNCLYTPSSPSLPREVS